MTECSDLPSESTPAQRLAAWYAADRLNDWGTRLLTLLREHMRAVTSRDAPVLNWREPHENIRDARAWLDDAPAETLPADVLERLDRLVRTVLSRGQNLHHPRYLGHQVPASLPLAALFDFLGAATNQVMAIYEMGPWSTAVECAMVERLGTWIGYEPGTFAGLCTHGGSLANLTALLTARNAQLNAAWTDGLPGSDSAPVLVVQHDVHYSVTRAAGILGIGTHNVVRVPVDARRKMRTELLDRCLAEQRVAGRAVVAVVAAACATPTGAFDPLPDVADVCQRHQVWLHVDAAHGGSVLLSDRHRHLVSGLERADSVVWDAHKMLFMPALCAFLYYRRKSDQFLAFQQDAPYLFDPSEPGIAQFDSGTRTAECTKRAMAFPIWATWALLGRQFFADAVETVMERTQQFHELLRAAPDFVPLHHPECNIQVFRHLPAAIRDWPLERVGDFQLRLRRAVITSGQAYLVPIQLDGTGALRATLINPLTTAADLEEVLQRVRAEAAKLLRSERAGAGQPSGGGFAEPRMRNDLQQ